MSLAKWGVVSVWGLLVVASTAKATWLLGGTGEQSARNALLDVGTRYVTGGSIGVDLGACVCLWALRKRRAMQGLVITYVGACFVLYHTALAISGSNQACVCMGPLGGILGVDNTTMEKLTAACAWYILCVGVLTWWNATRGGVPTVSGGRAT